MLRILLLISLCALMPIDRAVANGPTDITNFVICLNRSLAGNLSPDISNTVNCLPNGCQFTLTMSTGSAQAACSLGGCQLPRVILNCPGGKAGIRLRPSYLMCPVDSTGAGGILGSSRIEVGRDVAPGGAMKMADIPVPAGVAFNIAHPGSVVSRLPGGEGKDKECNNCHGDATPAGAKAGPILSDPISPFDANGLPFIIDTTNPAVTVDPTGTGTDGNPLEAQTLTKVCECIDNNLEAVTNAALDPETPYKGGTLGANANPNAQRDVLALQKLCHALQAYQAKNLPGN